MTQCSDTYCLLPVHALVEILKLQSALFFGASLPDAVGTFDPLLLEGMAACSLLIRLRRALRQDPFVHVDAEARLHVHKRHGADGGTERRDTY